MKITVFLLPTDDQVTMFPVVDIDQNDIVDTNGAGDSFVGGAEGCLILCYCF